MRKILFLSVMLGLPWVASAEDNGFREIIRDLQKAASQATQAVVSGAKVAKLRYRADEIYNIPIKKGMFTTFSVPKGEPILQFAVSNPKVVDLSVNQESNTAMLRLLEEESLTATIVTTKREYYLVISPARADSVWYTGVSWQFDEEGGDTGGFGYRASQQSSAVKPSADAVEPGFDPAESLSGHPNFDYEYDTNHPLAPAAVWDNGRYTWIQLGSSQQSIPAVFFMGPDGPEVISYVVMPGGRQIKVNRLMKQFMLRLGNQSLVIGAKGVR